MTAGVVVGTGVVAAGAVAGDGFLVCDGVEVEAEALWCLVELVLFRSAVVDTLDGFSPASLPCFWCSLCDVWAVVTVEVLVFVVATCFVVGRFSCPISRVSRVSGHSQLQWSHLP